MLGFEGPAAIGLVCKGHHLWDLIAENWNIICPFLVDVSS